MGDGFVKGWMMRVCFIGCGAIARQHLNAILSLNNSEVAITALVDPNEKVAITLREQLPSENRKAQVRIITP